MVGELAAHGLTVIVVVLDEGNPDSFFHVTSVGSGRGIGAGPSRDAFLHLSCHRSLPRTQEFRTVLSGRRGKAGRPVCIARLDNAIACLAGDPPRWLAHRAWRAALSRSCRRVRDRKSTRLNSSHLGIS